MGGDDDRRAALANLLHQRPEFPAGEGVEAGGGLVQDNQLGVVDEAGGQGEALLLAAGQVPDAAVFLPGQADQLQELGRGQPLGVEAAKQGKYLGQSEVLVVGGRLELHTGAGLDGAALGSAVEAEYGHPAGVGAQQPLDDFQGSGLSRAVGAQKTVDFAAFHRKGKAVHGKDFAVPLDQIFHQQRLRHSSQRCYHSQL